MFTYVSFSQSASRFKTSTSALSVSLKAGVSTNTIFESGNFEEDTLKAEILLLVRYCPSIIPPAFSRNFLGGHHGLPQHQQKGE
jgi:hypothetical protein